MGQTLDFQRQIPDSKKTDKYEVFIIENTRQISGAAKRVVFSLIEPGEQADYLDGICNGLPVSMDYLVEGVSISSL
ncbi:hypothetical protein [Rhodoflexus sp.]